VGTGNSENVTSGSGYAKLFGTNNQVVGDSAASEAYGSGNEISDVPGALVFGRGIVVNDQQTDPGNVHLGNGAHGTVHIHGNLLGANGVYGAVGKTVGFDSDGEMTVIDPPSGGSTLLKYSGTIPYATTNNAGVLIGGQTGTDWGLVGGVLIPTADLTVTTSSTMQFHMTNYGSTANYIMAVYRYNGASNPSLMFSTGLTSASSNACIVGTVASITNATLVGGTVYYAVIFGSRNGAQCLGQSAPANTLSIGPWRVIYVGNGLGTLTTAPATITVQATESNNGIPCLGVFA